ncbi:hypothetical protein G7Y89_g5025 [Cudoniella acicularis]|uniref:Heterokaryon incompatibility domain-containing protein n=1 Tax=Cudoniella acicularis TaxID=354080 RepID=A0A8H4W4E0_9HELO|nr:hypothetical protein G7Y89_g5025 [Cudoniella acicularis]
MARVRLRGESHDIEAPPILNALNQQLETPRVVRVAYNQDRLWQEPLESKFGNYSSNRLSRCRLTIEICTSPPREMSHDWYRPEPYFPLRVFRGRHKKEGQPNFKEGTLVASLSVTINRSTLKNEYDRNFGSGWSLTLIDQDIPAQFAFYTNLDSTFELGKRWLNRCLADHEFCRELRTRERRLPTRLIEIGMRQNSITASLRLSEELAKDVIYMTLSHCWGTIPTLTLTAKSYVVLRSGLHLGLLPKTFRDAMIISYRLGCNYVWIDSLCIIQDSQEDWARESIKMADVYQNSMCTISAMAAENSHSGCFVERNALSLFPCRITGDKEKGLYVHKCDLDAKRTWGKVPRHKPILETRGWALQELLLSPRIIKYGSRIISWECRQMTASEEWPHGVETDRIESARLKDAFTKLTHKQGGFNEVDNFCEVWDKIKKSYMSCSLTKPEDKLVAISGMIQAIQLCNTFNNVAGLWRENLIMELLWSADLSSLPKPTVYIAPSWSWASINGGLGDYLHIRNRFEKEWRATVIDVQVTHSNPGAFGTGQISDGTLTIRGIVQRLKWRRSRDSTPSPLVLLNLDGTECRLNDHWWPDEPVSPTLKIWGFPIVNWTARAGILGSPLEPHNIDSQIQQ